MNSIDKIIAENKALKLELEKKTEENIILQKEKEWYIEQLKLRQKEKFGKSSEQLDENQMTLFDLFNEVETLQELIMEEPKEEILVPAHKKKKGKRGAAYENLPVEIIEYTLEDTQCETCGKELHIMTTEIRKEIKIIPAQVSLVKHVTNIYSCRNCETTGTESNIVKAPTKKPLFPKSFVSPSVLAYIMNQKYVLALPLYRQEQEFKRLGVPITRQNLSNWIIKGANLLRPLEKALKKELISNELLMADETTLEVLHEPGREAHSKSYMWLYTTSKSAKHPVVLYDYKTGRSGIYAKEYLKDWNGTYLHCDGYAGYRKLEGKTLCGCYAHLRRYFHDAYKVGQSDQAKKALDYLGHLFELERVADRENLTFEERLNLRQEKSRKIVDTFYEYIEELSLKVLPKSLLGKAITYAQNQKQTFLRFLEDGRIELTNSRSERLIKMFVIGRKNFLFSNTPNGATSSALIYGIIQTALENNLKPQDYLNYIFEKLQMDKDTQPEELLPWAESIPEYCKNKNLTK